MHRPEPKAVILALLCVAAAGAQISIYPRNPWYWQYNGRPVLLFGGSDRDNLFQWANGGNRLAAHLDLLRASGGNYVRCAMNSREYTPQGYRWDLLPYPYARVDGKYDLRRWNATYWNRLRKLLAETKQRGIVVQLEIFDRWNESGDSEKPRTGWYDSPWNPNNNSTYGWSGSPLLKPGRVPFYGSFHQAAVSNDPVLLPVQQRYVEKIVDEVLGGGFDHVLFQIDNESGIGDATLEPDPYWARHIREYARRKYRRDVYVCTSRRFHAPSPFLSTTFQDWENPEVRVPILDPAFNYCDISQNNGNTGQVHYDNLVWYRSKVREHGARPINHVKCYYFNWPTGTGFGQRTAPSAAEAGAKPWRAVFGGAASIRFHRETPTRPGGLREGFGLSPDALPHLRSLRMLVEAVHLFTMEPRNDLLSARADNEAYCLAEPGRQYAVFFTGEGDRAVGIDLRKAGMRLQWLDVAQSRWEPAAAVPGGKVHSLTAPGPGHWVAVLRRK